MPVADAPIHATLPVSDVAATRAWYADKLGWVPMTELPGTLIYRVEDSFFTLFETEFAGTSKSTAMQWTVEDVTAEVARLRERGVKFEEYDFGEFRTVDGIMTDPTGGMQAWFKDPEDNIIGMGSAPQADVEFRLNALSPMLAAADLERARAWYADKLGLEPVEAIEGVLLAYRSDGTWFNVYATEFAGTAKNTVAIWRLQGIRDEVTRLRERGVVFDDWDLGEGGTTVDGILSDDEGDANAWFRDSEGNILALAEDRGGLPG